MYSAALAERVRTILAGHNVVERKMFGGLTFLLNGHMCCGILQDELVVRVGPEQYQSALRRTAHAREVDFTGRPMKGMVMVAAPALSSETDLADWVHCGVRFVSTLPPKEAVPRGPTSRAEHG